MEIFKAANTVTRVVTAFMVDQNNTKDDEVVLPEWINKLVEIGRTYDKESDRAAAILCASFFEHRLEVGLRTVLVEDSVTDRLFDAYAPLSTFSAKIDFAYSLGYVSQKAYRNLGLIRKIRNHFAHHPDITSFDVSPVRDWSKSLTLPVNSVVGDVQEMSPRDRYIHVATLMIFLVCMPMMNLNRPRPTVPVVWRAAE